VTSRMPRAGSRFLVGWRAAGMGRASIRSPPGCGGMRWRCSDGRNHRAIASRRDRIHGGVRSRGRVPTSGQSHSRGSQPGPARRRRGGVRPSRHGPCSGSLEKATATFPAAARALGVALTDHATVLTRAKAAVARIEAGMAWAQRTGVLHQLNQEYRRRRLEAQRRGERFMGYAQAKARLRRAIAKVAATGNAPVAIVRRSLVNNLGRVMVGIQTPPSAAK